MLLKKKIYSICIFSLLLVIASHISFAEPLSEIKFELLDGKTSNEERNPFEPRVEEAAIDPSSIEVQGIVAGKSRKLTLINGRPVAVGQKIGEFVLKDILPEAIIVQSEQGESIIDIKGFVPSENPMGNQYAITFDNAELQDAVRILAATENMNIIIPEEVTGKVSFSFQNTSIKEAMTSLLRVNNLEYINESGISRVGKPEEFLQETKFVTKHIQLKYATAELLVPSVQPLLSDKGSVTFEQSSNILSIRDNLKLIGEIEELVKSLDKESPQVHIQAKIITARKTFSHALGLNWGFTRLDGQVQGFGNPDNLVNTTSSSDGEQTITQSPANVGLVDFVPNSGFDVLLGNLVQQTNLRLQLAAAESRGDVNIISEPSITTLNNSPALIRSGIKFYVKNITSSSGGSATEQDLEVIETGIQLDVTPQITSDKTIKLIIKAEESSPSTGDAVDGIPAILDNRAETTILVESGETAVIGGMMKVSKSNRKNGVPFLSKIPILGWLFKSKVRENTDEELLIFITPNIVKPRISTSSPIKPVFERSIDEEIINKKVSKKKTNYSGNSQRKMMSKFRSSQSDQSSQKKKNESDKEEKIDQTKIEKKDKEKSSENENKKDSAKKKK